MAPHSGERDDPLRRDRGLRGDEGALGQVAGTLQPRALVLMNLFRDQLDRYGELETIAGRWGDLTRSLGPMTTLVLNADDPALAHLGVDRTREPMFQPYWPENAPESIGAGLGDSPTSQPFRPPALERLGANPPNVVLFGIDDPDIGRPNLPHAADTVRCGNCGGPLSHDLVTVGHLGHWRLRGLRAAPTRAPRPRLPGATRRPRPADSDHRRSRHARRDRRGRRGIRRPTDPTEPKSRSPPD